MATTKPHELTLEELATLYDQHGPPDRPARTLPIQSLIEWARSRPALFRVLANDSIEFIWRPFGWYPDRVVCVPLTCHELARCAAALRRAAAHSAKLHERPGDRYDVTAQTLYALGEKLFRIACKGKVE